MYDDVTTSVRSRLSAATLALVGLAVGSFATLYIAGAFGLSTATANNIVRAYEIGGWALTAALMVFSAGTAAAILAAIRYYISRKSRAWLVA
jgi:circularin A/uberolysin family circular bacteriocin